MGLHGAHAGPIPVHMNKITLHKSDLPSGLDLGSVIAVDTEAMGLNPVRDALCVVQISSGDGSAHVVQLSRDYDCPNLKALLADPAVLILDDATSAIDVAVEERIHEALEARNADRTTILIAHRLSTIALADRVILLDDGRVADTGTHEDLLANNPRYAAILADTSDDGPDEEDA